LLRFEGVDDRSAAEALLGHTLYAPLLDSTVLGDDEFWVHELVGATVVDPRGAVLGRVDAVEANPAHDQLVLDSGVLVPMAFVVEQRGTELVVDPPDGLLELCRASTSSPSSRSTSSARSARRCSVGRAPRASSTCGSTIPATMPAIATAPSTTRPTAAARAW
jgi:16S rRNA processing protein RimM